LRSQSVAEEAMGKGDALVWITCAVCRVLLGMAIPHHIRCFLAKQMELCGNVYRRSGQKFSLMPKEFRYLHKKINDLVLSKPYNNSDLFYTLPTAFVV
jgi:hypothetical protein